jgi:hypothetical protein
MVSVFPIGPTLPFLQEGRLPKDEVVCSFFNTVPSSASQLDRHYEIKNLIYH